MEKVCRRVEKKVELLDDLNECKKGLGSTKCEKYVSSKQAPEVVKYAVGTKNEDVMWRRVSVCKFSGIK